MGVELHPCKCYLGVPVGIACAKSGGVEEAPRPKMRENELLSLAILTLGRHRTAPRAVGRGAGVQCVTGRPVPDYIQYRAVTRKAPLPSCVMHLRHLESSLIGGMSEDNVLSVAQAYQ